MEGEDKVVQERLSVLELANTLGNVSEACRQKKISRAQFYNYRRRFKNYGPEGLKNRPTIHESHPSTTPKAIANRIVELSYQHPAWGRLRLSKHLALMGISVSGPTIQKILRRHGVGTRNDRWLTLEERAQEARAQLSSEQVKWLEGQNPCFRERHRESSHPGELLCQGTFYIGHSQELGAVQMQAVVDVYGSYAFARVHTGAASDHAVLLLNNRVIPFYTERGLKPKAILTGDGREYNGKKMHPYPLYLNLVGIEHQKIRGKKTQIHGFFERFRRTVLDEFVPRAFPQNSNTPLKTVQTNLEGWLTHYNMERPHYGYRNMGQRPIEFIEHYFKQGTPQTGLSEIE
jgi:hypothetical protein